MSLRAGVASYPLHKAVRAVASARYDMDLTDLTRIGHVTIQDRPPPDTPTFNVNELSMMAPGRPVAISTDEGLETAEDSAVVLTVRPTPSSTEEGKIVYLRVARMPLERLTLDEMEKSPEIPEEYHLDLCEGVGERCFRNADLDGASDRAARHEKRFNAAIAEALRVNRQKMFAPLTWNLGGNGFSWSR